MSRSLETAVRLQCGEGPGRASLGVGELRRRLPQSGQQEVRRLGPCCWHWPWGEVGGLIPWMFRKERWRDSGVAALASEAGGTVGHGLRVLVRTFWGEVVPFPQRERTVNLLWTEVWEGQAGGWTWNSGVWAGDPDSGAWGPRARGGKESRFPETCR